MTVTTMIALLIVINVSGMAQVNLDKVIDRTVKKTERKIENRVERRIDNGVDKSLDAVEDGIDGTVKGDRKQKSSQDKKSCSKIDTEQKGEPNQNNESQNDETSPQEPEKKAPELIWTKYDFIPGTEIIFEDNQEGEQNGEFPSKWDLVKGTIENANLGGENVIIFRKCNINSTDGIVPLLKNANEDYLPEEFTIEFDAYFENPNLQYRIFLFDVKNQPKLSPENSVTNRKYLRFRQNSVDGKDISTTFYPGFSSNSGKPAPGWRHIALSFNQRALKVYLDDARVMNVPNLGYNPTGLTLGFHNTSEAFMGYVKNIRIAKGAVPLYDKFLTDGKFITTGIKFDVNKSSIKPESMGTINYVVKMMQDHPELKFSVEGHTDSDGDEALNQKLSEARAKSVLNEMAKLGISSDRLTSKGHGESKPLTGNDTPEGKAQNRRVEFVKF
ncbi:MAG: OmpA family protein [Lentimicrobium sp.]|nr:OmpA family protein [Lentimicrobium sp.]